MPRVWRKMVRAFFLLSLFAFLGTQGRTLPEVNDKIKISNANYGSAGPLMTKSLGNGVLETIPSSYVEMTGKETTNRRHESPPPPSPYPAPPHIQITRTCVDGISYDKDTKMGRFNGVKPKKSPPPHIQMTSTCCCVAGSNSCNKVPASSK